MLFVSFNIVIFQISGQSLSTTRVVLYQYFALLSAGILQSPRASEAAESGYQSKYLAYEPIMDHHGDLEPLTWKQAFPYRIVPLMLILMCFADRRREAFVGVVRNRRKRTRSKEGKSAQHGKGRITSKHLTNPSFGASVVKRTTAKHLRHIVAAKSE